MMAIRVSGKICLSLALGIFFLSCTLAQAVADRFSPIVSALQSKDFEKALQLLQPALHASPGNAQLWAMQGTAYAGHGNTQAALVSLRKELTISPDYLPALQCAAQIGYEKGDPAAIPVIEHILRLRPKDAISHGMLAVRDYQQEKCAL